MRQFPNTADLLPGSAHSSSGTSARFDRAEEFFERAIAADPDHANNLANYASFLFSTTRKDQDRAEDLLERAIAADPDHANALGNYAGFLSTVRKYPDRAEELFERAIAAEPDHVHNLRNFAVFLMYERALAADPDHASNLGSYAIIRKNVRKDPDRAEELYERAIAADPSTPTTWATTPSSSQGAQGPRPGRGTVRAGDRRRPQPRQHPGRLRGLPLGRA